MAADSSYHESNGRSFSSGLISTPPLSTLVKPSNQGYLNKKIKSKPFKGEESSEEAEDENQDQNWADQAQENSGDGVSVSSPEDGASVAEAKPVGLAIAGPGGVASSKPQGTAVVGPGGLAIARPVGTAIAGVEKEGSSPVLGHKNKKKPKQEPEKMDGELHYVGGLTGPIGHPKPVSFGNVIEYKPVEETEDENEFQKKLFFRARQNENGFQFKLGKKDDKYGLIRVLPNHETGEFTKSQEFANFFHGLLGNNGEIGQNPQFQ